MQFLDGQILIAMPSMSDPRFQRSLVYLCAHSDEGAMGLVVNREAGDLTLADLFGTLGIPLGAALRDVRVRQGGPVEPGRGFVLHSTDYESAEATMHVNDSVSMTATLDILHAMGAGHGPRDAIVALGYAGWAPGQLEAELRQNGWLTCEADRELLFGDDQSRKWERALAKLGISASMLVSPGGSA
ncbi:YqgE/AlgH family protein [Limibaculum sp. FT325]|uniref:YqgE/AlgH family protein n=1 Tax=Thermohalobaculum sediminis TaxID=2939436 RepID=UPI0020C07AFA|nr:YqgE/AlgH family protein [Limibaculum sediminis]MCL5778791.1 YqgE/AlgH family protein [Limibaculum sediminis]